MPVRCSYGRRRLLLQLALTSDPSSARLRARHKKRVGEGETRTGGRTLISLQPRHLSCKSTDNYTTGYECVRITERHGLMSRTLYPHVEDLSARFDCWWCRAPIYMATCVYSVHLRRPSNWHMSTNRKLLNHRSRKQKGCKYPIPIGDFGPMRTKGM